MNYLPGWLKQEIPDDLARKTAGKISGLKLNTVCQQALCPNINDCFKRGQAAFLILGNSCTRHCGFCNVENNPDLRPEVDPGEPGRIAQAVQVLGLRYAVITSVTRDDLEDGGAGQFVKVIESIRSIDKEIKIEVLIPDFQGDTEALKKVVRAAPFVLAHNLETVERLYGLVRPQASYRRSLALLAKSGKLAGGLTTKSSLMLGFGEGEAEVVSALKDLRANDCDIVTLGQYLAPSPRHYPVKEFISPEQFQKYSEIGRDLGFKGVLAGPKVRSSYHAEELSEELGTVLG